MTKFLGNGISRRHFSFGVGGGASLLLMGCETQPLLNKLGDAAKGFTKSIGNLKVFGGGDIYRDKTNTPEMMKRGFDLYSNAINGTTIDVYLDALSSAIQKSNEGLVKYKQKFPEGSAADIVDVVDMFSEYATPALREMLAVDAVIARSKKRPSSPQRLSSTKYRLPPGTGLRVQQKGACMDPRKPAPVKGELLEMVYLESRVPDSLLPIFRALCEYAKTNNDSVQALTWMILGAGDENGHTRAMTSEHIAKLNSIYPNGGNKVIGYHNNTLLLKGLINKQLGKVLGPRFQNIDTSDRRAVDRATEDSLNDLIQEGLKEGGSGQPGFTLLGPNLSSRAVGSGTLTVDYTVVNTGPTPVVFDTLDVFAQPRRHRQAISPIPSKSGPVPVTFQDKVTPKQAARAKDLATEWTNSFNEWARNVGKQQLTDFCKTVTLDSFGKLNDAAKTKLTQYSKDSEWLRNLMKNASAAGSAIPFVGSVLSLSEALSGKDWLTQEPLSDAERALSLIGTVPGASLLKAFGKVAKLPWAAAATEKLQLTAAKKYVTQQFNKTPEMAQESAKLVGSELFNKVFGDAGVPVFMPSLAEMGTSLFDKVFPSEDGKPRQTPSLEIPGCGDALNVLQDFENDKAKGDAEKAELGKQQKANQWW